MSEFLTIKETAALLRVSPITIRRYIASGELAAERVGRGIRVRREAIEDFVTPVAPRAKHLPLYSENAASTHGVLSELTGESVASRAGTPTPSHMRTTVSGRTGKGQPSRRDYSTVLAALEAARRRLASMVAKACVAFTSAQASQVRKRVALSRPAESISRTKIPSRFGHLTAGRALFSFRTMSIWVGPSLRTTHSGSSLV